MQAPRINHRLNLISTQWALVRRAHHGPAESASLARQQLLERYGGAVRRYLRKLLLDTDAADEVFQEFALRLVRGDLRGADPKRGRFRNFLKGTLFHLIADYRNDRRTWPKALPANGAKLASTPENAAFDRDFKESWCDELLARAWAALAKIEASSGQSLYAVLRFRADHPELHSPQIAGQLSTLLSRPFTAAGIRQSLRRAREKFATLLLDEVSDSIESPTRELLEQELLDLGLLDYCRPALKRLHRCNHNTSATEPIGYSNAE